MREGEQVLVIAAVGRQSGGATIADVEKSKWLARVILMFKIMKIFKIYFEYFFLTICLF